MAADNTTPEMKDILIKSTIDETDQPSLFHYAGEGGRPLVVGLHTWSANRFNQVNSMLPWAIKNGWNLLLPEFRGPNLTSNPQAKDACGSKKAKQDVIDAVDYIKANYDVDGDNILLVGGSGGGHMALLMAGYAPSLWRAVASFVPLTDVEAWYHEKKDNPVGAAYADHIAACCGGEPSPETYDEYRYRSPMTYIAEIARSNTKIFTGKFDPSIPSHHGLDIFCEIFNKYPDARVFIDMFDGGHHIKLDMAEDWFKSQMKGSVKSASELTG